MGVVTGCPCCGQKVEGSRLLLSPDTRTAQANGRRVRLARKEMLLVDALRRRAPGAVTHDALILAVWDRDEPQHPMKALQHLVLHAREKLKPLKTSIVSEHRVGYRLAF